MANTRFNGTILHGNSQKWRQDMPQGNSTDHVRLWDDFSESVFNATDTWTVVKDAGAAVALVADTAGGEVALTSAATTDNDGGSIQGNEIFLPAAGRTIWFEARVKLSDATQSDMFVGLCENFATNPENCLTASNRIGFQKDDGSALILCKSEIADAETSTTTAVSMSNGAYVRLGFIVRGTSSIEFFVDRQKVATHTSSPATELAVAFFHLSGDASGTKVATMDYVEAVATR